MAIVNTVSGSLTFKNENRIYLSLFLDKNIRTKHKINTTEIFHKRLCTANICVKKLAILANDKPQENSKFSIFPKPDPLKNR